MLEHAIQRPRNPAQIEGVDEHGGGLDLPAASGTEEAPELLLIWAAAPGRLILKGAVRGEVSLSCDNLFHGRRAEAADQLVFQVGDADKEANPFHAGASQFGAEARALESALEIAFLGEVTQARQPDAEPVRAVPLDEGGDVRRAPHRHDGNTLRIKVAMAAEGECLERQLVADPFNEYNAGQPISTAVNDDQVRPNGASDRRVPTICARMAE